MKHLDKIVEQAKDNLRKDDGLVPTVLFFGKEKGAICAFPELNDTPMGEARETLMKMTGEKIAQEVNSIGKPEEIYLVSEAWMSVVKKKDQGNFVRPSEDPNKKEVMIVSYIDVGKMLDEHKPNAGMSSYEMVRDEKGKVIDLKKMVGFDKDKQGESRCYLLEAFIVGYVRGAIENLKDKVMGKKDSDTQINITEDKPQEVKC